MSKGILEWLGIDRNTKRRVSSRKIFGFGGARRLGLEHLEDRQMLATLTVNTNEDIVDTNGKPITDDGLMTLRDAIAYINDDADPPSSGGDSDQINLTNNWGVNDTIIFSDGTGGSPDLDGETITLDEEGSTHGGSMLWIKRSVIIDATAGLENGITIEANEEAYFGYRIFHIQEENSQEDIISKVELAGLTIKGGNGGDGGGIYFITKRDGVEFKINNSTIKENSSSSFSDGGGIYFTTSHQNTELSIEDSEIIDNETSGNGMDSGRGGGVYVEATREDFNFNLIGTKIGETSFGNTAVCGGGVYLLLNSGAEAIIENCMFQANTADGSYEEGGGGLYADVYSSSNDQGKLTINNCMFEGNIATLAEVNNNYGGGGGIFVHLRDKQSDNISELNLLNSTISGNVATNCDGGGVWVNSKYGTFNCEQNTISGNSALFGAGGGLWMELNNDFGVKLTADLTDNTISGNSAGAGGGLWAAAGMKKPDGNPSVIVNLLQNTISGNIVEYDPGVPHSGEGGGLWIGAHMDNKEDYDCVVTANIDHTTITVNHSSNGGGFYSEVPQYQEQYVTTTLSHTIVSGNDNGSGSANNIAGAINSNSSYNLIGWGPGTHYDPSPSGDPIDEDFFETETTGNIDSNDPDLRDLGYYGGPTQTHMPIYRPESQFGPKYVSPVIDTGNPALDAGVAPTPEYDQRGIGFSRVVDIPGVGSEPGQVIDIGACEYEVGPPQVIDVLLDNPNWGRDAYSFAEHVPLGEQLRPFATQDVTQIQIRFSEEVYVRESNDDVRLIISDISDGNALLKLKRTRIYNGAILNETVNATSFTYHSESLTGTWGFPALVDGKYAIHLKSANNDPMGMGIGISDCDGMWLDGDWTNPTNTPDNYLDDPPQTFPSGGDGTEGSENNEFRFHFALLAGDSDGDGIVEAATEGEDPANDDIVGNVADIDGDGDVGSQDDISLAEEFDGNYLPLRRLYGCDFVDDEIVDGADLAVWIAGFGEYNGSGVAGDADGDGDCDGNDFLLWQQAFGDESAWYISSAKGSGAAGSGYPIIGPDVPQIVNVIISGSLSQHDPYSFADALYNGLPVIGSGYQLVTVPVGGADTITIVFSEAVNISASSLDIVGLTTANEPTLAEFAYDVSTHTASWRFEGWALGDRYLLMVSDAVTDVDGNLLDGEWVNPASMTTVNAMVSEFPSGDGDPGGNFHFLFTLLPGDANLDLKVDIADYAVMSINWGLGIGDLSALFSQGDFSGDGMVSSADMALLLINFNRNLQNTWILADFDGDFDVDDDDLAVISANAGMTGATWEDGDLNGDGEVTVEDFDLALALFGLDLEIVS